MYDLQRANFWKRISAWLLDAILLLMLSVAIACLLELFLPYDSYADEMTELESTYSAKYAEKYGIDPDISEDDYNNLDEETKQKYDEASKEMANDQEYVEAYGYAYSMCMSLLLIIVTFSILFAYVILEFVVPLLFKNGQTVGKKVFALGVMHTNSVRISNLGLFVRTVLGKYTIETMVPVMLIIRMLFGSGGVIGIILILIILIMQIFFIATTKGRFSIHDLLSSTVVVDLPSQRIFANADELNEYKKRLHAEAAEKAEY